MIDFFGVWFVVFGVLFLATLTVNALALMIDIFDDFLGVKITNGLLMFVISSALISFVLVLSFQWSIK